MTDLRDITEEPQHFAGCCVGISRPLIALLLQLLPPKPATVISIGCGTGLLELLLLDASHGTLDLHGIEVSEQVNKYLPSSNLQVVPSDASLWPDAWLASAWLFVYPHKPALVASYLKELGGGAVEKVVWLGPANDWPDYEPIFVHAQFTALTVPTDCGLPKYEVLVVAEKPRA